jgi:RNA polymerase sigma factor (sigma-70 family)
MLIALSRIGELRDRDAAGSWLRAIVRNVCLMHIRSNRREVPLESQHVTLKSDAPAADAALDHHALRNWTWTALDQLSPPLQLVVLLPYFSGISSDAMIAAICELPVGTVRSRLNEARRKLGSVLTKLALGSGDHEVIAAHAARRRTAASVQTASQRGEFRRALTATARTDMSLVGPQGQRSRGTERLARMMDSDLDAGVRQRVLTLEASRRFAIMECALISPPSDPHHCPPQVAWLMSFRHSHIDKIRLYHPSRS